MTTPEKLRKQRATIKAKLTRLSTFVKNATNCEELQTRIESASSWPEEFKTIYEELGDDELLEEYLDFEETYYSVIGAAKTLIKQMNAHPDRDSTTSTNSSIPIDIPIRLPVINLPQFSGKYEDWMPFFDSFKSLVHENVQLSDIQKFHYLHLSLQGEAKYLLNGMEKTATNYIIAWDLLQARYQNKRLLINNHIKGLFDIPTINRESATAVRHLLDEVTKHLRALNNLGVPVNQWDAILIYVIATKLDFTTRRDWEEQLVCNTIPTFQIFEAFLSNKCQVLEAMQLTRKLNSNPNIPRVQTHRPATNVFVTTKRMCPICSNNHYINQCDEFLKLNPNERKERVSQHKLCHNCLGFHKIQYCKAGNCKTCQQRHHSLLHTPDVETHATAVHYSQEKSHVFLSTATVFIEDNQKMLHSCRVLLDSGAQSNFMTEECARRLKLSIEQVNIPVYGVNQLSTTIKESCQTKIKSRLNSFTANLKFLLLPSITTLPGVKLNPSTLTLPRNISLADPYYFKSTAIDAIIGAQLFYEMLCIGQIKPTMQHPCLQKTHLGWVLSGNCISTPTTSVRTQCTLTLNENVARFWSLEEVAVKTIQSPIDQICEEQFTQDTFRNEQGRFVVKLPLKPNPVVLGNSIISAKNRFHNLEVKFSKQKEFHQDYVNFMQEYLELGHMKLVQDTNLEQEHCYLPHHGVTKITSTTTKLRVVFDGSAKTTTGASLNDKLLIGPRLQDELFAILLRFREHKFVITADIAKMYRQILLHPEDMKYHRILWRQKPTDPLQTYELQTVTYGTSSAPYLAIKCLRTLAERTNDHNLGRVAILRDFYVDDLLSGADTLEEAMQIKDEVTTILSAAGFNLRKWTTNAPELQFSEQNTNSEWMTIDDDTVRTLGVQWSTKQDKFRFCISPTTPKEKVSKRTILSQIAKIFDPLGLIGPVITSAKIIMQQLWQLQLAWDESVPTHIYSTWVQFKHELQYLKELSIPRCIFEDQYTKFEIHGFADASNLAYGACVYVKSYQSNDVSVRLVCSKSRVAPLKPTTTPRLELCAALLLVRLMSEVKKNMIHKANKTYYWTDSTIVLAWIKADDKILKSFVANRTAEIREHTNIKEWRHISGTDNPADIISRGMTPRQLMDQILWWNGPKCLEDTKNYWPVVNYMEVPELPEVKPIKSFTITLQQLTPIFNRVSTLSKLERIMAYCHRFINNCKTRQENRQIGQITINEMNTSQRSIVKLVQQSAFEQELKDIQQTNQVQRKSQLFALDPFIDECGIIRVGGRLNKAIVPYNQKHPVVIPRSHELAKLIIRDRHNRVFHAGAQATLAAIRCQFWIIGGRRVVVETLKKCVICFKARPTNKPQKMATLPSHRTVPARPFINTGVDFCGPILIKQGSSRSKLTYKAYISVFVCMATKAVHLELVTSLSTEAFLATFKRFIARRGHVSHLYSDNGTNFVGANNEIKKIQTICEAENETNNLRSFLTQKQITWHFIPPRAPHFGGLWEAAVKSMKYHLRRILGNSSLNYEEMSTLLCQIEAILNYRPLTQMSEDPNDETTLTPGHFLIGDNLLTYVEPNLMSLAQNRLSKFQYIEQLRQHFWKRWSREYLGQLQTRTKWKSNNPVQLKIGHLVIIKEDNVPPAQWITGRVLEVHPGSDGVVRTASIQINGKQVRRSASKLCILPIDE